MPNHEEDNKDKKARALLGNEHADKYVEPIKEYDHKFQVTDEIIDTFPDLQNGENHISKKIEQVGIHNFRLPITFSKRDGGEITLETSVTGMVSLEADKRGINMSRVMRTFYDHKHSTFSLEKLKEVLLDYQKKIGAFEANILLKFSYPLIIKSLRSRNEGWQYYEVILEGAIDRAGKFRKTLHLDFVYSSACPCSTDLAAWARKYRNRQANPHSQRSVARISVDFNDRVWIEDVVDIARVAMKTETQVVVKREDEMAFAELNADTKFVEDAARRFAAELDKRVEILDYKVVLNHLESLHSHDACAQITKGEGSRFSTVVNFYELRSLVR